VFGDPEYLADVADSPTYRKALRERARVNAAANAALYGWASGTTRASSWLGLWEGIEMVGATGFEPATSSPPD
jgi:hypothetical protein